MNPDFFKLIWFVNANAKIEFSIFNSQAIGSILILFEQIEVENTEVENPKIPEFNLTIHPRSGNIHGREHARTGTSKGGNIQGREHFEHAEFTMVHLICRFKCCGVIS